MPKYSAYMNLNSKQLVQGGNIGINAGARSAYFFKFEDDEDNSLTGIQNIQSYDSGQGDGYYYDLRGQRVVNPRQPGLYIHNGKKIYVK